MILLLPLLPAGPPLQGVRIEVDRDAERPDVDAELLLLSLLHHLYEGFADLRLLGISDSVDEELGLPDRDDLVDLADDDVEAPVPAPGVEILHALVLKADELGDQPLELGSGTLLAALADELFEADHEGRLTDHGDAAGNSGVGRRGPPARGASQPGQRSLQAAL